MPHDAQPQTLYHRHLDWPGIELSQLSEEGAAWRFYCTDFNILVSAGWQGRVWHRNGVADLRSGEVLCCGPGDVTAAEEVWTPGSLIVLSLEASLLRQTLGVYGLDLNQNMLRDRSRLSPGLLSAIQRIQEVLCPGALPGQSQPWAVSSSVATVEIANHFLRHVAAELVVPYLEDTVPPTMEGAAARQIHTQLCANPSTALDLKTLAAQVGMSRFRALRTFKRRYGLPPHRYHLQLRLGLAKRALRAGMPPSHVATACGFVDQSHFTRHFKRLLGATPAQYARATRGSHKSGAYSRIHGEAGHLPLQPSVPTGRLS